MPLDLQGHELCGLPGGVRDEIRIDASGNVELVKRVGKLEVSSASNMTVSNSYQYTRVKPKPASKQGGSVMSDRFAVPYISSGSGDNPDVLLRFELGTFENQEAMNQWFAANPVTVLYELAEPQVIPLGKVDMPTLPAPVANAWVESDVPTECAVRYARDMNIVIGRLEEKLAAVAGAVSMLDVPTVIPELEE